MLAAQEDEFCGFWGLFRADVTGEPADAGVAG